MRAPGAELLGPSVGVERKRRDVERQFLSELVACHSCKAHRLRLITVIAVFEKRVRLARGTVFDRNPDQRLNGLVQLQGPVTVIEAVWRFVPDQACRERPHSRRQPVLLRQQRVDRGPGHPLPRELPPQPAQRRGELEGVAVSQERKLGFTPFQLALDLTQLPSQPAQLFRPTIAVTRGYGRGRRRV